MATSDSPSHGDFQSRLRRSGYGMGVDNVAGIILRHKQLLAWQQSCGHDHNLLDARVQHMEIGAASDYVTFIGCR